MLMQLLRSVHAEFAEIAKHPTAALLVLATTVGAVIVNVFVLPGGHLVSSLYAIPILIAGYRFQPHVAIGLTVIAVALYLQSAWRLERPMIVWLFSALSLMLVGVLTYSLAMRQREIAQRAEEFGGARQRLQEFIAMVSHDLAGALTSVMFSAEMLSNVDGDVDRETSRFVSDGINDATGQMRRLLNDLRDASAIGSGHFTVQRDAMDLVALTRQIVGHHQALAPNHAILLDAPDGSEGEWDRERVNQLLTNLVTNAIKYSHAGSEVRVSIRSHAEHVLLAVSDNGPGIDPAQQAMLFEPFQRLNQDTRVGGTGLGLSITRAIVEAHGGQIWVESALGTGSTFYVTLPLGVPVEHPLQHEHGYELRPASVVQSIEPERVLATHAHAQTVAI